MIDLNTHDLGMREIGQITTGKLREHNVEDLNIRLYVFGVQNKRPFDVYISPHIEDSRRIARFLQNQGVNATSEEIGNPAQNSWISLRREFRLANQNKCSQICILTLLSLNNLITW